MYDPNIWGVKRIGQNTFTGPHFASVDGYYYKITRYTRLSVRINAVRLVFNEFLKPLYFEFNPVVSF